MHQRNILKVLSKRVRCSHKIRVVPTAAVFHGVVPSYDSSNFSTSSSSKWDQVEKNPKTFRTSSSVSPKEVSKFSDMASLWWKPQHNPLISMNPTRMKFITSSILEHFHREDEEHEQESTPSSLRQKDHYSYEPLKHLVALDVGCGGGLTSESLARLGASVTGIDPSVEVAQVAETHSRMDEKTCTIKYMGGISVEDLLVSAQTQAQAQDSTATNHGEVDRFDIITILEVIEHATDPDSLIQAASMLLKKPKGNYPGGLIFVSTINKSLKSFGIAIVGGEYITGKLPIGTHDWNQFKSPKDVENLMNQYGLETFNTKGMILKPPFYDLKWYLHDTDMDVNWIGAYRFKK